MSRQEKLHKLANAVRDFRGASVNGKYIRTPKPKAVFRVVAWLDRLGNSAEKVKDKLALIASFKAVDDFEAWIRDGGATK